jgi:hypothetical protein
MIWYLYVSQSMTAAEEIIVDSCLGQILPHISSSKIQLQFAKAKEADGRYTTLIKGVFHPQGADPHPPSSFTRRKTGRNHLNEEITPLLPTGIGE